MNKLPVALLLGFTLPLITLLTGCGDKECAEDEYQTEDGTCNPYSSKADYVEDTGSAATDDTGTDAYGAE